MSAIISARSLRKTYVTTPAVDGISFDVIGGESVALLGENGSGKTTLLSLLIGLIAPDAPPDGGEATVLGSHDAIGDVSVKERIGLIADYAGPVPWANGADIAQLYAGLYKRWDMACFDELYGRWSLDRHARLNTMSKGQRRLAEVALTVSTRPSLLILDEPFNGLDPVMRHELHGLLRRLQSQDGVTILYSTHILSEVEKLADRVLLLRHGKLIMDTPVKGLPAGVEAAFLQSYDLVPVAEAAS